MSLETSRKILKVFGILAIIFGILGLIAGVIVLLGGSALGAEVAAFAAVASVLVVIGAIVTLLEGIFSVRAAKDSSKIMPAFVFALLGLVFGAISFVSNLVRNGGSGLVSNLISLAIRCLVFIAANTIRKNA